VNYQEAHLKPIEQMASWMELCEQAAKEQDPKKLVGLISGLNAVLDTEFVQRDEKSPAPSEFQLAESQPPE
jgi:hypothetical protein